MGRNGKTYFSTRRRKNPGGASLLIKEGVLENPKPDAILGLHVHPGLATGKVSFRAGKVMASADELYFTIKGKGWPCGGSAVNYRSDPYRITFGDRFATGNQPQKNPLNPSVLSITAFNAGTTTNVIPGEVKLMGTFRAMDEDWRFEAHELIRTISHNLVTAMGAELDLNIDVGYPNVFNNEPLTVEAKQKAIRFLGNDQVEETEIRMGAEDFGYYTQKIPGCFYRLGVMSDPGNIRNVHTPTFDINENAIETGMGMMAWLAVSVEI
ncbi:M20 metallopeptidase family protein [Niabella hibiscisoli]|uniref:M20 metallopeptidase family protein n=1 Tax=Niabella hibiscisoli TaxID=1825928 RepID=UPI00293F5A41|nr:M20/M25/M40 family metallo-hydrolase [Niabella hibiscisoli]